MLEPQTAPAAPRFQVLRELISKVGFAGRRSESAAGGPGEHSAVLSPDPGGPPASGGLSRPRQGQALPLAYAKTRFREALKASPVRD
jgi:hypothetical protein